MLFCFPLGHLEIICPWVLCRNVGALLYKPISVKLPRGRAWSIRPCPGKKVHVCVCVFCNHDIEKQPTHCGLNLQRSIWTSTLQTRSESYLFIHPMGFQSVNEMRSSRVRTVPVCLRLLLGCPKPIRLITHVIYTDPSYFLAELCRRLEDAFEDSSWRLPLWGGTMLCCQHAFCCCLRSNIPAVLWLSSNQCTLIEMSSSAGSPCNQGYCHYVRS